MCYATHVGCSCADSVMTYMPVLVVLRAPDWPGLTGCKIYPGAVRKPVLDRIAHATDWEIWQTRCCLCALTSRPTRIDVLPPIRAWCVACTSKPCWARVLSIERLAPCESVACPCGDHPLASCLQASLRGTF